MVGAGHTEVCLANLTRGRDDVGGGRRASGVGRGRGKKEAGRSQSARRSFTVIDASSPGRPVGRAIEMGRREIGIVEIGRIGARGMRFPPEMVKCVA